MRLVTGNIVVRCAHVVDFMNTDMGRWPSKPQSVNPEACREWVMHGNKDYGTIWWKSGRNITECVFETNDEGFAADVYNALMDAICADAIEGISERINIEYVARWVIEQTVTRLATAKTSTDLTRFENAVINLITHRKRYAPLTNQCPIRRLHLNMRCLGRLNDAGIMTVADLLKHSEMQLSDLKGIGIRSVRLIAYQLKKHNLRLA